MKILYIAHRINEPDGSGVHCRAFVENARKSGHEVETFPPIQKRNVSESDMECYSVYRKFKYYLSKMSYKKVIYFFEKVLPRESEILYLIDGMIGSLAETMSLMKVLHRFKPDIMVYRNSIFRFAPFWTRILYPIPLVVELNSFRSIEAKLRSEKNKVSCITRWAEKKAVSSADSIFCVSRKMKEAIQGYSKTKQVSIIPNGVDIDQFCSSRYDKLATKDRLGLSGKTILGYVGSYKTWHGVEIALKVIEVLSRTNKTYHLLLIGNGEGYSAIREKIIADNLQPFVTQIERVPHDEVPLLIACFDYALMSYPDIKSFHGSPLKMFEYMAMSIPVVATDVGQLGEVITNGKTGFLVYPPTPENFAKAILDSARNGYKHDEIGSNARRLIEEDYSWLSNAKNVVSVCERVLLDQGRHFVGTEQTD